MPRRVRSIIRRLNDEGFQAYPVGGCVRDLLMSRQIGDWDLTTNARPEQVIPLFPHVVPTGIAHGTVTIMSSGKPIEVTTYRGEVGYSDGRHPDRIIYLDSLEEDLKRRDFTVNSMALDIGNGRLVDPFGGRRDLRNRCIRAVGKAEDRFCEDGLRPLRAIRFATVLDFEIDPPTFTAISTALPIFRLVAAERIREELLKILASNHAARGIELLRESGMLAEILPELLPTIGHPQNRFHRHDVYRHTLTALNRARGDGVLKLAVLLHDLGKPAAADGPPGEFTFFGHEQQSAAIAGNFMNRLRFSKADRERVHSLVANHMFHYESTWTDGAVRRLVRRLGSTVRLTDLWELRRADAWGRSIGVRATLANLAELKDRVARVLEMDSALKVTDLKVSGKDVMTTLGVGEGPVIGEVLNYLLEQVIDNPSLNESSILSRLALDWIASRGLSSQS